MSNNSWQNVGHEIETKTLSRRVPDNQEEV